MTAAKRLAVFLLLPAALALAGPAAAAAPHVVFLVAEPEYKSAETLPVFAQRELEPRGIRTTFVYADEGNEHGFSALRSVGRFDLLFVSVRRRAPAPEEMAVIRAHLAAGRPLVGIRTASHAFAARGDLPPGHVVWADFDVAVLGGRYDGHYRNVDGTDVLLAPGAAGHPILAGVTGWPLRSGGTLYRVPEIRPGARVLLRGTTEDKGQTVEHPVAWTYTHGRSRVFYTSLGHPADFDVASFRRLLTNAVLWALGERAPVRAARRPPARKERP